jgi:hypothetical protein
MITFLGTEDGIAGIRASVPTIDPLTRDRIELVTYRDAFRRSDWHSGAIIFGDLERQLPFETVLSTQLWQRFSASGAQVRLLNHPTRSLYRFALLRKLKTLGMHDFDVWRADEDREGMRFPVLLHGERDHNGPIGGLVRNRRALDRALGKLGEEGRALNGILVIEFCETRTEDGLYRKYGTFRVGERLVHRHMFLSSDWCVKTREGTLGPGHSRAAVEAEEEAFMLADRFSPAVAEIFRIAAIDYGRMDYAFKEGGIRVWEINTNPLLGSPERYRPGVPIYDRYVRASFEKLRDALLALDPDRDDTPFWIDPVRPPSAASASGKGPGARWRRIFGARRARGAGVRP